MSDPDDTNPPSTPPRTTTAATLDAAKRERAKTGSAQRDASETRTRTRTRARRAASVPAGADAEESSASAAAPAASGNASAGKTPSEQTGGAPQSDEAVERRMVRTRVRRAVVTDPFTVTVDQPVPAPPAAPAVPAAEQAEAPVLRRRRRRSGARDGAAGTEGAGGAAAAEPPAAGTSGSPPAAQTEPGRPVRARRRSRAKPPSAENQPPSGQTPPEEQRAASRKEPKPRKAPRTSAAAAAPAAPPEDGEPDAGDGRDQAQPTRLQARSRRAGRSTRGARGRGGRRVLGGVSEETRRAITEGPPRRMLVSVGAQRTQIAVLEERTLVEHYVTHRSDASYVGNIYQGRVQNVLPGMEAAFIDIGKGRNGVLYAGEVNYDEADLETELPRIEQTLKPGQPLLVQVTKDPMGTKGARLTQHLSIAGRYCVLAPGDGMLGISRKLTDEERERLRRILKEIKPEEFGLIVRTAAEGATAEQLQADVARLARIWSQVMTRAEQAKPLEAVYEEPDLVIRVIRDVFGPEYSELVVDSEPLATQVRDYLADVSPELVDRVSVYAGESNILDAYEVTNQIRRALEKKVWLASGGYLIVEKTEAMWVIDVNTGKFVGEHNLEETVLRNNIEAAVEIARQLRLRDMGGIIVIDFVDMLLPANRSEVLKRFRRELARDKTKSRVMEISKLGLVQMTRKNVSKGLQESFTARCDECEGRGSRMIADVLG